MAIAGKTQKRAVLFGIQKTPSLPLLLTFAAVAIGLAALLPLIQSSGATDTNAKVQRLGQELTDWEARTHELELEIATMSGLERISQEAARRFQMVPAQETIYLTIDKPGPEPARLPSRFLPQEQNTAREGSSSFWDKLFGWMPWP